MPFEVAPPPSRYTPIGQIGRGGMAEAILAEMRVGHGVTKLVVLKRMWPDLATDADFVSMFVREARLSARMNHPNVVQTYEVLDDPKRPIGPTLVMEYLDGQPLTRILHRMVGSTALGLTLRLRIVTNVLAALDYAHELTDLVGRAQGVVHRDVNPQNVFVTYTGQVKLLDFGVAKSLTAAYRTRPGLVRGKLGYMAPEQVVGAMVDRRADLFAVGVMLWEMVSGRRMWQGRTDGEIVRHLASFLPMPPVSDVDLPRGLQGICARALAARPQNRYASAAEFAGELERLLVGSDDAHRRNLGRVVCLGFGPERAARRSMIENHLTRGAVVAPLPPPLPPPRPPSRGARPMHDEEAVGVTINLQDSDLGSVTADDDDIEFASEEPPPEVVDAGQGGPTTTRVKLVGECSVNPWRWGTIGLAVATVLAIWLGASRGRTPMAAVAATTGGDSATPRSAAPPTSLIPSPSPSIVVAPMGGHLAEDPGTPAIPIACVSPSRGRVARRPSAVPLARPIQVASRDEVDPFQPIDVEKRAPDRVARHAQGRSGDDDILQPSVDLSTVAVTSEAGALEVAKAAPA
ncbi:MAG: protein kinase, partial [Myxococcales bacterium]